MVKEEGGRREVPRGEMKSWSERFEPFYANVNYAYARSASVDSARIDGSLDTD